MKKTALVLSALATLLLAVWLTGCGDDHLGALSRTDNSDAQTLNNNSAAAGQTAPALIAVHPADGTVDHPATGAIGLRFSTPMDPPSVMGNMHLVGGADMAAWMDSLENHQGMGGMGDMMFMSFMRDWMDSICVPGEFQWCEQMDSCIFMPDSAMEYDCDYMIMMEPGGMMSHDGMMMDSTGCHSGGFLMYYFRTDLPEHLARNRQ